MHAQRRRHVVGNLADRVPLVAGQLEGEMFLETGGELPLEGEADPRPCALGERAGPRVHELLVEQLVEREAATPGFRVRRRRRPMHGRQRGAELRQAYGLAQRPGQRVVHQRQQRVEVHVDEPADLAVRQALRRRVDGEDEPALGARVSLVRQDHEFARHELTPVIVAHRPGHEQQLSFLDLALEERLSRPGALEHAAGTRLVVAQHRPEHPQALACGENAGARHPPYARHVLAHVHLGEGRDGGGIEVAVRRVIQQVAHRA